MTRSAEKRGRSASAADRSAATATGRDGSQPSAPTATAATSRAGRAPTIDTPRGRVTETAFSSTDAKTRGRSRGVINVGEDDFTVLANAANDALDHGDIEQAAALDKIARKINATLSRNSSAALAARMFSGQSSGVTWEDMPTTLIRRA